MRSSRPAPRASAALLACAGGAVALAFAACGVEVDLDFPAEPDTCDFDGVTLASGEVAPSPDGCMICSCQDGEISCTESDCDPCPESEKPTCADMPVDDLGCTLEPQCGDAGWECVDNCPCAALLTPECPPPFDGCFYQGPYCEGQQWTCGPPVCPSCTDEIVCDPPADPMCYSQPVCNDQLVWECQQICPPCDQPPPECGGVTIATCEPEGWVCEGNAFCGADVIDCPPSVYPYCTSYAECSETGWLCQESCELVYCPDDPLPCESMGPPGCTFYPTCTPQGWLCVESCT